MKGMSGWLDATGLTPGDAVAGEPWLEPVRLHATTPPSATTSLDLLSRHPARLRLRPRDAARLSLQAPWRLRDRQGRHPPPASQRPGAVRQPLVRDRHGRR